MKVVSVWVESGIERSQCIMGLSSRGLTLGFKHVTPHQVVLKGYL